MTYIIRSCGGWQEDHYTSIDDAITAIIELLDVEDLFRANINEGMQALDFGSYGQILPADALEACNRYAYRDMLYNFENHDLWILIRDGLENGDDVIFGISVDYDENDSKTA